MTGNKSKWNQFRPFCFNAKMKNEDFALVSIYNCVLTNMQISIKLKTFAF